MILMVEDGKEEQILKKRKETDGRQEDARSTNGFEKGAKAGRIKTSHS